MNVLRAESAGFCMGVSLALRRLETALAEQIPGRLITLGPIIHNPLVMQSFTSRGVISLDSTEAVQPGDRVVIRAHGVPRETEQALEAIGASVIDATCPKVKKAQLAIARQHQKGGTLLLFGEEDHPEVRGLVSYAGNDAVVFGTFEELERLSLDPAHKYYLAAQTTQEKEIFVRVQEYTQQALGKKVPVLQTICDATKMRQTGVLDLSAQVDIMVVVGGLNSGNTRRLAEVSRSQGIHAIHVEQPADFTDAEKKLLAKSPVIGLTAGASTPEEHIQGMQLFLEALQSEM